MNKTRVFWLKSDNKSIEEIHKKPSKRLSSSFWRNHHIVTIHGSGELYTNRNFIPARQVHRLIEILEEKASGENQQ